MNMRKIGIAAVVLAAALVAGAQTLFFAGDSTLDDSGLSLGGKMRFPYQSWGTTLQESMKDGCKVANYARSGASTKSFVASGMWAKLIAGVKPGDFVAIQFGHNDQKRSTEFYQKERWADPKGLFREIVRDWVKDIRAKGASPILLSPICRGTFDKTGKRLVDSEHKSDGVCLRSYRDAMRELSAELGCDFVDMNTLTWKLLESLGKDESMKFFVISTGVVKGKDGEPAKDVTHPIKAGAEAFAKLFIEDVTARNLAVAKMFRPEAAAACCAPAKIDVAQDRADALYRAGEEATFSVAVRDGKGALVKSGEASWKLDNFGDVKLGSGKADLAAANPFTVKGTMKEEGFLRLTVNCTSNRVVWGVGYDVGKIRQDEPCPKDFDAYWTAEKARLEREVPLDAKCVRDEKLSNAKMDCFRVSFATFGGKRVYGFMSVPTDKSKAPFRIRVEVPGAGPGATGLWGWNENEVGIIMNVHCFEPGADAAEQKKLMQEQNAALAKKYGLPNPNSYCANAGVAESREDYWYHDVMLGINRAVDWVCARPDVDLSQVTYTGSSQGGGFGLFLNYLNPHFTKGFVAVCAITGHFGYKQGRQPGWPQLIWNQPKDKRAAAEKNAAYFDGVNFAARITHPMRFIVGFADTTCPPADVYAAYNVCPAKDKAIVHAIGSGHGWYGWYRQHRGKDCIDFDEWLRTK